jgi:hypothetical protein
MRRHHATAHPSHRSAACSSTVCAAYLGKTTGGYDPFVFGVSMSPQEMEISEDVYVITAETAEAYVSSTFSGAVASPPPFRSGNTTGMRSCGSKKATVLHGRAAKGLRIGQSLFLQRHGDRWRFLRAIRLLRQLTYR